MSVVRSAPRGWTGAVVWLAVWFCVLWGIRAASGGGAFLAVAQIVSGVAVAVAAVVVLGRFVRRRMLWSVRNKLVLTYLLFGLAPVVLGVMLVAISAYVAAGQFAIHLADTRLWNELNQMQTENQHRADLVAQMLEGIVPESAVVQDFELTGSIYRRRMKVHRETEAFVDGVPVPLKMPSSNGSMPLGLPQWAMKLQYGEFQHLVSDGGELYLVTLHQQKLADGKMLSVLTSLPVNSEAIDTLLAGGLGRVRLQTLPPNSVSGRRAKARDAVAAIEKEWIGGGSEPPRVNLADIRVGFGSTESMRDWDTGEWGNGWIAVDSRPSLLYSQLFGGPLGVVTSWIRGALIGICVLFTLIEMLALWMATGLSRTITESVENLYRATLHIDIGDFTHRIEVTQHDQLAELSQSFNRMTGSLQRLMKEQKEKERMQNELSIAQEVQANLFPKNVKDLATLELYGVCRPARSVSGDYYDFLTFHEPGGGRETGVAIAMGDISGKGISAALLMATLHSAVRAYRFASEEIVYAESSVAGLTASRDVQSGEHDRLFESPGHILSLLNRHLYRSTQPEKYATLFLAHYNVATATLTYSNAGQLPPLVLSKDGSVRRLDKGGTVVGLMDGMRYEEDRVKLVAGDILVAYSDGVTEPENKFGEFGEDRLVEVVQMYRDQPLHVIAEQVLSAVDAWIGAEEQPDDITLVLARQI